MMLVVVMMAMNGKKETRDYRGERKAGGRDRLFQEGSYIIDVNERKRQENRPLRGEEEYHVEKDDKRKKCRNRVK